MQEDTATGLCGLITLNLQERMLGLSQSTVSLMGTRSQLKLNKVWPNFSNFRVKGKWSFVVLKQVYSPPNPMFSTTTPPWLLLSVILESSLSVQPPPPPPALSIMLA